MRVPQADPSQPGLYTVILTHTLLWFSPVGQPFFLLGMFWWSQVPYFYPDSNSQVLGEFLTNGPNSIL